MLASVRNLDEARLAAACGVDWLDLKEPGRGALGAVDLPTVTAVAGMFGTGFRISATIGDCWETPEEIPPRVAAMREAGAAYVKVGAFAQAPTPALLAALRTACTPAARVIVVCFAEAPPSARDLEAIAATGIAGAMLDTAHKDGPALRQLMDDSALSAFVTQARRLRLLSGLAGRLAAEDVAPLRALAPDYLGFRGALCDASGRTGLLDERRVRALRRLLRVGVA